MLIFCNVAAVALISQANGKAGASVALTAPKAKLGIRRLIEHGRRCKADHAEGPNQIDHG